MTTVIGSVVVGSGVVDCVVASAEVVRLVIGLLVVVVVARVELDTNFRVVGLIFTVVSVVVLLVVVVVVGF